MRSAVDVVWKQGVRAEIAVRSGWCSASIFVDWVKFYEQIEHETLLKSEKQQFLNPVG